VGSLNLGGLSKVTGEISDICCSSIFPPGTSIACPATFISALKIHSEHLLTLCELEYWNGTILNVAHDMIPVGMEFMHVLSQRPCSFSPATIPLAPPSPSPIATANTLASSLSSTVAPISRTSSKASIPQTVPILCLQA
jgi:hypothetical protein